MLSIMLVPFAISAAITKDAPALKSDALKLAPVRFLTPFTKEAAEQSESTPAEPAAEATDEPQSEVAEVAATE